jgi:AraC-like DNA-binding protein
MIDTLTNIVLTVGGFQLYLLAAVVLVRNGGRRLPKGLFAAFLLTKALLITRWFCYSHGILSIGASPALYLLSANAFFLLAPFLYLYVNALCYKDFRLSPAHLWHAVPFLAAGVLAVAYLRAPEPAPGTDPGFLIGLLANHYWSMFWTMNLVQILCYILAGLRTVRAYQARLGEEYSTVEGINMHWLVTLLAVIGLHWLFVTSRSLLALLNANVPVLISLLDLFSITIFLVFTTLLVVRGLGQIRVFAGVEARPKYAASKLPESQMEAQARRLRELMASRKPHLTPSLTLEELSTELAIPSWQLSQIINRAFGQNFFSFVNGYRVEEAKCMLSDPASNGRTVLDILLEVGFNSKSAFNEAFRRHTGMTPREFKRASQN